MCMESTQIHTYFMRTDMLYNPYIVTTMIKLFHKSFTLKSMKIHITLRTNTDDGKGTYFTDSRYSMQFPICSEL
jgi:hypothetical protein